MLKRRPSPLPTRPFPGRDAIGNNPAAAPQTAAQAPPPSLPTRRWGLGRVVLALAWLTLASDSEAHAILVKAQPEKGAVLAEAPKEVLLIFNDAVGQEFLALAVVDAAGRRVDKHDARLDLTDHSHLRASLHPLAPGPYLVRYRVLSADGHVVSGKYTFRVQPP
ncbi:copper resistance CopC family protein [Candidatus Methylocalor cossyra]|uniref:Copper resistance protein C n=1 Tax=Candidatus Methylocalor cossyra TaxID=3108543 RepID=A0ABP1C8J5_9GAMM